MQVLIAIIGAISFSLFLYIEYFDFYYPLLNSLLAILGFWAIFKISPKNGFYFGFLVGVFWFWWIGVSLMYYNLSIYIPLVILLVGIIYGGIFYLLSLTSTFFRAVLLFFISMIHPFGFNWFEPKLVLMDSYFGISSFSYVLFLLGVIFLIKKRLFLVFVFFALSIYLKTDSKANLNDIQNIKIIQTKTPQIEREQIGYTTKSLNFIFKNIHNAIKNNKKMIIFPETIMPIYFNLNNKYEINKLKLLSKDIDIIMGALYFDSISKKKYNSMYIFSKSHYQVYHKHILTPIGESVPLPKMLTDWINNVFYDDANDFSSSKDIHTVILDNKSFRLAICYEITRDELFENAPPYMIAISNNSWFYPSIQGAFQNLLIRFYAKKYNTIILHSANLGKSSIIY